jgi:large subunit ribosomal protein L24
MIRKIIKGDTVCITTGKDKGKTGVIERVLVERNKVIVKGLNQVTCFNKKAGIGMTKKDMPLHISNVMHIDPVSKKPVRVKIVQEGSSKAIVSKESGKIIRQVTK